MNMIPKTPLEKPLPPALEWRKTIPNLFYVEEGFLLWFWKSDTFRLSLRWQLTMGCCCNGSVTNWAKTKTSWPHRAMFVECDCKAKCVSFTFAQDNVGNCGAACSTTGGRWWRETVGGCCVLGPRRLAIGGLKRSMGTSNLRLPFRAGVTEKCGEEVSTTLFL